MSIEIIPLDVVFPKFRVIVRQDLFRSRLRYFLWPSVRQLEVLKTYPQKLKNFRFRKFISTTTTQLNLTTPFGSVL